MPDKYGQPRLTANALVERQDVLFDTLQRRHGQHPVAKIL
jgi:hypothetical protein